MPHTLEMAADPHLALAEATRCLVPEGRLVIVGFNPVSLWAMRQRLGRTGHSLRMADETLFLPSAGEFIGYWRLRDWLRLLSFDIEVGQFGCYRPPWSSQKWLDRFELDGARGRALVAGAGRGLLPRRGAARARHAPDRARCARSA